MRSRPDAGHLSALAHSLIIASLIVVALIAGREILEPLVIAALLAFILSPLIRRLRQWPALSGAAASRRCLSGMADQLRRSRAVLHRGRAAVSGPRPAWRGSDRAAGERAVSVSRRSATSRASSSSMTTSPAPACGRFMCRSASCWTKANPPHQPLHPLRHLRRLPCLVQAKSDAQVMCVDPALATQRHAADQRRRHAARDQRLRSRSHARASSSATARRRRYRPTSSSSRAARSTRPRCCCARRTIGIRDGLGERLRCRRPPLHGSHQLGADGDFTTPESDDLPEDARA